MNKTSQSRNSTQLRQQATLAQFGELALRSNDLDEILSEACSLVAKALKTDLAKVMELDDAGKTLLARAGVGWKAGVIGRVRIKVSDNTSEGAALKSGEPIVSPNIDTEKRFTYPQFLTANGVKAVANVVIIGGLGKPPFGILQVDSRKPRAFTSGDVMFLRTYANLLAATVDRLRAIRRIEAVAARLEFALRAGGLGVWELDLPTGKLSCSELFWDMFGRTRSVPTTYREFKTRLHPDDVERVQSQVDRSSATGADFQIDFRILQADGSVKWVQEHGQVIRAADGTPARLAGVVLDITERILTDDRMRQSQRIEAVGRLTSGVAHDFNNVLQALLSGIELAIEDVQDQPEVLSELEQALLAGQRGARLTSHLLSFSRQQVLLPVAFELPPLVKQMSRTLARTLGRTIDVTIEMEADLPLVFADPAHLDSALLNLALNARDALDMGGKIRIEAHAQDGHVIISVSDNGRGMSPEILDHACEPFFTTKGVNGSGLGLSMAQGFARQSGGELTISSTLGKGTRAEISLPTASGVTSKSFSKMLTWEPSRITVLIVDDDVDVGRVTSAFLHKAGFEVVTVVGANQALAELGAGSRVDAIVADYAMPGMTGGELILQAREIRKDLPALIITGYPGAEELDRLPPGVAILRKPFKRSELIRRIRDLTKHLVDWNESYPLAIERRP